MAQPTKTMRRGPFSFSMFLQGEKKMYGFNKVYTDKKTGAVKNQSIYMNASELIVAKSIFEAIE